MRNTKEYSDNEYLLLSGIQHFCFCRRQWALIHIEKQWMENVRTIEGSIIHKNAHDSQNIEVRNNTIISRGMPISSAYLGLSGECDVVEFIKDNDGINIAGREGKYIVCPVEYKRGHEKENDSDVMQLVAQAICLEEMLCCVIKKGYLFYYETRRRKEILITDELRVKVEQMAEEMHKYYERGYTPIVKGNKHCNACSLREICLPKLMTKKVVKTYINQFVQGDLYEKTTEHSIFK